MIEPINDTDVKEIEDISESRKDEIAKMSRKELNAHALLLEQEQVEYEREKRQLLAKLAEKEAKLNQAVEALEELHEVSTLMASRIGLSITAKRMQGKNESADLEEEKFFKPWEKAAEKSKTAIQSIKSGESDE